MITLELTLQVPDDVDENTLSHLVAAKHTGQGITIRTATGVFIDGVLVEVDRVVEFIDDVDEEPQS